MLVPRLLLCALVPAAAMTASAETGDRPADFGKRWVRSHPFTIMALTQRPQAVQDDRYVEVGCNAMLAWKRWERLAPEAQRMGIPYHCHLSKGLLGGALMRKERHRYEEMDPAEKAAAMEASRPDPMGDELRARIDQLVDTYPGAEAFIVWDEPKRPSMKTAGKVVSWLKGRFPEALVYSNAYPYGAQTGKYFGGRWEGPGTYQKPTSPYDYPQYLRDLVQIIGSDLVMVDAYPYKVPPEGIEAEYLHNTYFKCLADVRRVGLELDVPYWIFVQAYGKERYRRMPSESDLRMQLFAALTFGFTGITYFTYDHVFDGALLRGEETHETTPLYHAAARASVEVANLGRTLRFLTSTDMRFVAGHSSAESSTDFNLTPHGLAAHDPRKPVGPIQAIALSVAGPRQDALIGLFRDDDGGAYLMVTNLYRAAGVGAGDSHQEVTLTFDPSVERLHRLDRETGAVEAVALDDHRVTITLPAGTGDLFSINEAAFPGLGDG